jgi:hypothetical protein
MIENAIKDWLNGVQLAPESAVLALIAIKLAAEFDSKPHTSTAAELRKTILEIMRQLDGSVPEFDPLASMLKR